MIVSHHHRYVFLAVPHTASTAIGEELCVNYGGRQILGKHAGLDELRDDSLDGALVFCTVRNPVDVAATSYFRQRTDHHGRYTGAGDDVASARRQRRAAEIRDSAMSFTDYLRRFQPTPYVNWMLAALGGRADLVLRYEELDAGFATAVDRIGLDLVRPLPRVNATSAKDPDFWAQIAPEARDHVMAVFGPFFREWGYAFPSAWGPPPVSPRHDLAYRMAKATTRLGAQRLGWDVDRCAKVSAPLGLLTRWPGEQTKR